jgi:hypothetical protein
MLREGCGSSIRWRIEILWSKREWGWERGRDRGLGTGSGSGSGSGGTMGRYKLSFLVPFVFINMHFALWYLCIVRVEVEVGVVVLLFSCFSHTPATSTNCKYYKHNTNQKEVALLPCGLWKTLIISSGINEVRSRLGRGSFRRVRRVGSRLTSWAGGFTSWARRLTRGANSWA